MTEPNKEGVDLSDIVAQKDKRWTDWVDECDTTWSEHSQNPHLRQAFQEKTDHLRRVPFSDFRRILWPGDPGLPYHRRRGTLKTLLHWGQRKLLLAEIEFLTLFGTAYSHVVYAGAAPGSHIEYLSALFPDYHFHLVDPNEFTVLETPRIHITRQYFDDALAKSFSGKDVLFISDIRTANPAKMDTDEVEKRVKLDQDCQQRWHLIMNPRKSLLKFRLPWTSGITEYLDGHVYFPVWGPQTTSECRLVPHGTAMRKYDNQLHENQMFRFNTVTRQQCYYHPLPRGEGVDHCYDCTAEVFILAMYMLRRRASDIGTSDPEPSGNETTGASVLFSSANSALRHTRKDYTTTSICLEECRRMGQKVLEMSRDISRAIAHGRRRLGHPQPPAKRRRLETRETVLSRTLPPLDNTT